MAKRRDKKRKSQVGGKTPGATRAKPLLSAWLPRPHPENRRIFYLVSNYTGTAWYRCHVPGRALSNRGHTVVLDHQLSGADINYFDVIVFQYSATEQAREFLRRANELGKTTVFEIDDDYWNMTPDNPVYEEWRSGPGLRLLRECMQEAQVVTTTTPYLARILGQHHRNVKVLPNMLPEEHWHVTRPDHGEKVVVGWAGGVSHYRDVQILSGTMEQLLDEFPDVELWLAGMLDYPFSAHPRIRMAESVRIEELGGLLCNFDIGLAPLVDTHFTRCKSDLKYLEYSKAGAAVIASAVEAYEHTVINGKNGLLATSPKDWMRQIRRLIEDPQLRGRLAGEGGRLADSRMIEKNVRLWEEAYGIG